MAKQSDRQSDHQTNYIKAGTHFEGNLKSDSNIRMDGTIVGNIQTNGKLVIGKTGVIEGEVSCQNAEVEGKIIGKIIVQDLLSLKASATMDGDILTGNLNIEPGAVFNGSSSMGNKVKQMNHEQEGAEDCFRSCNVSDTEEDEVRKNNGSGARINYFLGF